ncbi:hypothetical protein N7533_013289 [Penicillium manginii]|jgi:hypothetical protein|uniref:uncharacterized protein n=1 Tax=Penicillium manginii TaxID=203109 RepID=UPI002547217F|nr:uncharacterized protein N7533_013289 [Penicillium manginii]KAJ5732842.1 hypothetical protein N7533_013289 [Penicillium manginii]
MDERKQHQGEYWNYEKPKRYSRWTDALARTFVAFIAAAWLIVPIIIMTVPDTSKWKILGVLIGATSLFGLSLAAFGTSFKDQEILVATAAYAAVLVVFYGNVTNIPGAGSQQVSSGNPTA